MSIAPRRRNGCPGGVGPRSPRIMFIIIYHAATECTRLLWVSIRCSKSSSSPSVLFSSTARRSSAPMYRQLSLPFSFLPAGRSVISGVAMAERAEGRGRRGLAATIWRQQSVRRRSARDVSAVVELEHGCPSRLKEVRSLGMREQLHVREEARPHHAESVNHCHQPPRYVPSLPLKDWSNPPRRYISWYRHAPGPCDVSMLATGME
jgi:hypothetical protein